MQRNHLELILAKLALSVFVFSIILLIVLSPSITTRRSEFSKKPTTITESGFGFLFCKQNESIVVEATDYSVVIYCVASQEKDVVARY